jgi:hypothetical protein
MKKLLTISLFILVGCKSNRSLKVNDLVQSDTLQIKNSAWSFSGIEGSKLLFDNGRAYETSLFHLDYIGQILINNKDPYIIYSGIDCDSCDADISIYIHSPSDGKLIIKNGENRYGYPGREYDLYTDSLVYEGQAYYGEVLPSVKGIIWYQKVLKESRNWESSIFLVDISNGLKIDTFLQDKGQLKLTLSLLEEEKCIEISGHEYRSTP